jgi:anaerobic magnesium-protoporphyrin IX monomethyl ester cyclase
VERTGTFRPPINLALLAAYIRKAGHEPRIFHCDASGIIDVNSIVAEVMQNDPQVVGFSCMTPRIPVSQEIARACKEISPQLITVIGGPHVSGDPESISHLPSIDYAIIGEGEGALLEFLNRIEMGKDLSTIPNLVLRYEDKVKVNPARPFIADLDQLPLPAWDLLPMELYKDPVMFNGVYTAIISSRGCAWDCNFCASAVVWKRKVRMRSAENVVKELKRLVDNYNICEFMFYDDTFTTNPKRAIKICELIKDEGLQINFRLSLRADTLSNEVVRALKEAGCSVVFLGVESGDEQILKEIDKGVTKNQIRRAASILKEEGLPFIASYMIGHPGDTHETIQATIDFAKEIDSDQVKFCISEAFPGTRIYEMAKMKGLVSDDPKELSKYTTYQHIGANLSLVSDEDLKKYQIRAYEEYDLRKRPLIN